MSICGLSPCVHPWLPTIHSLLPQSFLILQQPQTHLIANKETLIRKRHLHQIHHTRFTTGWLGYRNPGTRRSVLYRWEDICKRQVKGKGKRKRADYILYYRSNPVAIIEAKDNNHSIYAGIQQALDYARILDIPCVFSSNGDGFLFHNRTLTNHLIETELTLEQFPSPEILWQIFKLFKGLATEEQERVVSQPYYSDGSGREPRYYQEVAINRTIDAIVKGQNRVLLVMATGTGKTYTAFQIVYRLWKARVKKRILFLADRNALIDQTKKNDFRHFGDKMTWVKKKQVDKSYEIYLALYQGLTGAEEDADVYKQFSPDFFDLIIIDECHRGSAKEDSAWRDILDHFKTQHILV